MKLLVVEDEGPMAGFLRRGLTEEGFAVDVAEDAAAADSNVGIYEYDAILLDVMLPGVDGFELCRKWRSEGLGTPILFLTARDGVDDRVKGLEIGGDDYLVKPFSFDELLARVRALIRRSQGKPTESEMRLNGVVIDTNRRAVRKDGQLVPLTTREYQLLEYLARHPGRLVTRTMLWEHVWESGSEPDSNVIDVYIRYLRTKLGRDLIETIRGAGYILQSESSSQQPGVSSQQPAARSQQSAARSQQSAARSQQSAFRNPQSEIRNPQSAIRNAKSEGVDLAARVRERTFRARIALHTAGLCVSVLALAGASIYFGVRQSLLWSLNNALLAITRTEIAAAVDDPKGELHLHEDYPAPLNLSAADGYEKLAQVQDWRGSLLGQTPNLRGKPPLPLVPPPNAIEGGKDIYFADITRDRQPYRVIFYPVHDPLGNPMTAVVALSREPVDHALFMLLGTIGLAMLVGGAAAGFGADRLSRRLTRPLESMAAAARQVRDGNLSIRIPDDTAEVELRDVNRVLNEMLERLERSFDAQARIMSAQRRFLGDASHELRSPLGNIRGTIEVAIRKPRLASQYREALQASHAETMRMCRLVDDLLTLSRADAGQFAMEFSPCDLSYIARQAAMAHAGQASQAEVTLWVDASGARMVNADRDRLRQVVDNLLDNAIRYAPGGSTVSIRTWAEGTRDCLSVEDTGQGLTLEEQSQIFERFFRTDRARSRHSGGLGLGLAIGAAILEAHHGTLTVQSRPAEGATFTMTLPAMVSDEEPAADERVHAPEHKQRREEVAA